MCIINFRCINNSIFNIKELRIGAKTIRDIKFVVVHRQQNPVVIGKQIMNRIGRYKIDQNTKTITFQYKED